MSCQPLRAGIPARLSGRPYALRMENLPVLTCPGLGPGAFFMALREKPWHPLPLSAGLPSSICDPESDSE